MGNMLNGVGMGDAGMKKCQLIKRLTNQGYNLQVMGVNCIREFLTSEYAREEEARLQAERDLKEKDRILRRIMNTSVRFMGMGFRQALQWTVAAREAEIALMAKQRGIMRRIVDSNVRLMSAGWNKLLEAHKARNGALKDKLKFVIKALTDKDAMFTMMAYNAMKQRMNMLNGVGMGDAGMKKCQLIKSRRRKSQRRIRKTTKRKGQNPKKNYERKPQNDGNRIQTISLMDKQRGIMRRIVDSNVRLMSAGWNKLLEAHKA